MTHKYPKNSPVAWYLERYGWGIGNGSPGVDDEWARYLLQEQPLPPQTDVEYFQQPSINIYTVIFLLFLVIFVLWPVNKK